MAEASFEGLRRHVQEAVRALRHRRLSGWTWGGESAGRQAEKADRLHGRHVLNRYEDGMEKCIGCELAPACALLVHLRPGADNDPDAPTSPGERFGYVCEINYLRCIHCDLCVEACPTQAITESKLFEFSFTNRSDAIYTKDELLVGDDGRSSCRGKTGSRRRDDVWLDAGDVSGRDHRYEGVVHWAGELYGVREPEVGQSASREADRVTTMAVVGDLAGTWRG